MSHEGQKRRFQRRPITSGLTPTPDILSVRRHVSKVPMAANRSEAGLPDWRGPTAMVRSASARAGRDGR
jgi:hypothetical protein